MKPYILLAIIINCVYHGCAEEQRDSRMFSLFNVVKFRNTACQSTTTTALQGTCYTAQECSDKGGTAEGNCASSFGVCCIQTISACGGSTSENCTYIESASFPTVHSATGACNYVVNRAQDDICQIRLDFTTVILLQPTSTTGACDTGDTLTITGGDSTSAIGSTPPILCGTLTGQHLYLDAGSATAIANVNFAVAVGGTIQMWRIKTSQVECGSKWAPPQGCLQYYMGNSGTVTSFNYDGGACTASGCFLNLQEYTTCFRQEPGMCGIQFYETTVSTGDAFLLTNGAAIAINTKATCATGWVSIHADNEMSNLAEDVYCGNFLAPVRAAAEVSMAPIGGAVQSHKAPFEMRVLALAIQNALPGFSLDYTEIPCSAPNV